MLKLIPILSEYSYAQVKDRVYMVKVEAVSEKISKIAVKTAIENQYNVNVESIRISTRKGKALRFSRGRHAYPGTTYHRDQKIAYVTVKEGQRLPFFDEYEKEKTAAEAEAKKADKKSAKTAKEATKAEKKGDK